MKTNATISKSDKNKFYALTLAISAVAVSGIAFECYYTLLLPVVIFLTGLAFWSIDKMLLLIAFAVPLSINVEFGDSGFALSMPSEPLIIGTLILFLARIIYDNGYDAVILRHPITIAIFSHLAWIFLTTLTSEVPFISFKFFIAQVWFILVGYLLAVKVFANHKNIYRFLWLYISAFIVVVYYAAYGAYSENFTIQASHKVMYPFYKDHTIYGAVLALFLPFTFGFAFNNNLSLFRKILVFLGFASLLTGLILSNTRAAWIGVAAAIGIYVVIKLKIKWYLIAMVGFTLIFAFMQYQEDIMVQLQRNKQESSDNINEHVKSITNVTSDASNLERINRWNSALRMFYERPILGWGPGSYSFVYAPFQHSSDLTIISTNSGNLGNAHSEYLGPLAETGIPGLLLKLTTIIITIITAIRIYAKRTDIPIRYRRLALWIFLGLCTYWVHGFLNNFLDVEKAAIPYWGFIAIIVAIDLYGNRFDKEKSFSE